ncbi:xanthine dehydrogenase family protein molybdopterin-binding subunit [Mycolicibacterium confluentis]|uniref:Aldehyde dehydrogenase n=1 Tax=Mycolicibacterium confluentis TaxID=28047 RepID=A0A7I7Y365_9MYCO|nr:xanthine dehydrogenase family protein molybdopterin-binding subunit [Mycolicibacterium confluentis]MCV7320717.1 xanthine dehydrogenase family protein molybdopterin-binding subunit [Mycolicibacterium confluentis]BBZ35764.1 aldehyde dehydrogenase [Mycolicibacterium confluentis]
MSRAPHVGQSPPGQKLRRLAAGGGSYLADEQAAGELHLVVVRSREAHARISVDTERARTAPGVHAVLVGADVRPHTDPMGLMWTAQIQADAPTWCLAGDRVRYVGEPIAAVIADDAYLAEDAAELVDVTYERLPAVVEPSADSRPLLYADWTDNVFGRNRFEAGDPVAALAESALVVSGRYTSSRVAGLPLETRGVRAMWDITGESLTMWTSTQALHQVRASLSDSLRVPESRIRVCCPDVGGAFGNKVCAYVEETLVAFAARVVRRPVRWIESRPESFVATVHGRGTTVDLELGFNADGTITGLRATVLLDCGATPYMAGAGSGVVTSAMLTGPYRVSDALAELVAVVTNKTPIGAYRGFGMPEATFAIERALDEGARRLEIDPMEIRQRNLLRPDELPYWTPAMMCLDSGRYGELLGLVADRFDWDRARREAADARAAGRLVGVGTACYLEASNFGPSTSAAMMGINNPGHDRAVVRMDASGLVTVLTGQTPMGQGVETVLAQVAADEVGVALADVSVVCGDTQACPYTGYASGGSRGAGVAGSAVMMAARGLRAQMRAIAAHLLEVDPSAVLDTEFGFATVAGKQVNVAQVAQAAWRATDLPPEAQPGLEAGFTYDPQNFAFTFGAVAAAVEIDPDTGTVTVQRLVYGHDCGVQLNPALVEGQIHGSTAQGIGAALYEELPYTADGQPVVQSLWDYAPPLPGNMPPIESVHLETPSPFSLNGAKGAGESGAIPLPAVVANAIRDALGADHGHVVDTVPITAERLLAALSPMAAHPMGPLEPAAPARSSAF